MGEQKARKLGKYRIIEEIGRGGFSVVYKALDTSLRSRPVALKVLHPHLLVDPTFVQRFQQEAGAAANLRSPNIVVIHEVGEIDGTYYIAMEYLPGTPLDELIKERGPLCLTRALKITRQMANALDYAHEKGFIHRDVKSGNMIIGEDDHATLTDFGLVRAAEGTMLTSTGRILGTPEYMSPEQAEGEKVDYRSDLYSLGVVVYEMATGDVPFRAETPVAVLRGHTDKPPPRPTELNPDVPRQVEDVLLKALAKGRDERYQSGRELAQALQEAIIPQEPRAEEKEVEVAVPEREPAERAKVLAIPSLAGRVAVWIGAGVLALVVIVVGFGVVLSGRGMVGLVVPTETATATVQPTATWTYTPTRLPTSTALSTETATATATSLSTPRPSATAQPTDTPTVAVAASAMAPTSVPPTSTTSPALQGRIFFSSYTGWDLDDVQIYVMDGAGGERTPITRGLLGDVSRDGSKLLYAIGTDCGWGPGGAGAADVGLYVLDVISGQSQLLVPGCHESPALSPDLSTVVYRTGGALYVWEDGRSRNLTEGDSCKWSPDGSSIAYVADSSLRRIPAAGGASVRLAGAQSWRCWRGECLLSWSPDGSRIAYGYMNDIWVVGSGGGEARRLTTHEANDYSPAWSPDGSKVVFVSERHGNRDLYVINADGTSPTRLTYTSGESEMHPSWSH